MQILLLSLPLSTMAASFAMYDSPVAIAVAVATMDAIRTLLTSAQQQKGALEDSFASGKESRKAAGGKYGW